jgi:hypothetical protein
VQELEPSVEVDISEEVQFILCEHLGNIKAKYASFVSCLSECLIKKKVTAERLRTFVINLHPFDCDLALQAELHDAGTVNKIIDIISAKGASFFQYDTFQRILKEYDLDHDNPKLNYSKDFDDYVKLHKISEFFNIDPELEKKYSGSTDEEITFKFDIRKFGKLKEIVDLRHAITRILRKSSPKCTLQLARIAEGCVMATFLIPRAAAEMIFTPNEVLLSLSQLEELRSLPIFWIKFGDRQIHLRENDSEGISGE